MNDSLENPGKLLLGIDIGTTGCKSILFDADMNIVAESFREYGLIHSNGGFIEQDPEEWQEAVKYTVRETVSRCGGSVGAIGISSQGITFVPVDEKGEAICNAITWLDQRACEGCGEMVGRLGAGDIFQSTGKRPDAVYILPKLMWLKKNRPVIYEKTYKFLTAHDYILKMLCGRFATEHSLAAGSLAYDIHRMEWSREILEACGISMEKLPEILPSGTMAGTLEEEPARSMGLNPGIPVSTGGQDQKCAAFGAGLSSGGIAVSLGTSAAITAVFDRPVLTEDMGIPCFPYIYGGKWVLEGFCSNAGGALKWFRDNVVPGKSYAGIDRDIGNDPAGALVSGGLLFMPNMSGTSTPEWYGGGGGGFIGLTLDSTSAQMAASIMEGVAFVIRANILKMETYGSPVKEILVFGGGAGSRIWLEIMASVTGRTVMVPRTKETACAGAALMAGNSAGIFSLDEEGEYERLTGRERFTAVEPDMNAKKFYDAKYMRFRDTQARIYGGG